MAFRSAGSVASGTGTSAAVPVPSGVAIGDIVTVGLYLETTDATITPPSGFTQKNDTGTSNATTRGRLLTFWKRLTAADAGTYSFTWTTSVVYAAQAIAHSGIVRIGDPFETHAQGVGTSSSGTTAGATAITTANVNTDLVTFATSHATNSVWTPPTGMTEQLDNTHLSSAILDDTAPAASFQKIFNLTGTSGNSYPRAWIGALIRDRVAERNSTTGTPASTSSETITLPTHESGDRLILVVTGKAETATIPTINQGWTLVKSGTGGTGAAAENLGPLFIAVYAKDATSSSETAPTLTAGASAPNTWVWTCHAFKPANGKSWIDSIGSNAAWVELSDDTSTAANGLTITPSLWSTAPTAGDAILAVGGVTTSAGSAATGTPTMTATGLSNGLFTYSTYGENAAGNDCAIIAAHWLGFGGTATGGLSTTLDVFATSLETGPSAAIALRQGVVTVDLTIAGQVNQPTVDFDLSGFNDSDLTIAGQVNQPVADFDFEVEVLANDLTIVAQVNQPTVDFDLSGFNDSGLTIAGQVNQPTADFDLDVTPTGTSLTIAGQVNQPTADFDLDVTPRTHTHTWNRAGGRSRRATANLEWEPPVAPTPPGRSLGVLSPFARAFEIDSYDDTGKPAFAVEKKPRGDMLVERLIIDGRDRTFFRNIRTVIEHYEYDLPFGYGPAVFRFPRIGATETLGAGDLDWCDVDKRVRIDLVDPDTDTVVHRGVWHGQLDDPIEADNELVFQASGAWSGDAVLRDVQLPRFGGMQDIGRLIWSLTPYGIGFTPRLGPVTGIRVPRFGGMRMLDAINNLLTWAQTKTEGPYTIKPEWGTRTFSMVEKATTGVDATFYAEGRHLRLERHRAGEPNRVYGYGVTPNGQRVANGRYPGLLDDADETITPAAYPFNDERNFGLGTTDADTDTGDGITVMQVRLRTYGLLSTEDYVDEPGEVGEATEAAINRLRAIGSSGSADQNGMMTLHYWNNVLFNVGRIGQSIWWSKVEPMAQTSETIRWQFSADGSIIAKNPDHVASTRLIDETNNYGVWRRGQMFDFSEKRLELGQTPNVIGELEFETGGLLEGDWEPVNVAGITDAHFMDARLVRPDMRIRLPYTRFGDITVYVATVKVSGGRVTATVSLRPVDSVPLWEALNESKERQKNAASIWWKQNRSSGKVIDSVVEFEEIGGQMTPKTVTGGRWHVFKVLAGQIGMIERFRLTTTPDTRFVAAVFGLPISAGKLNAVEPDPLTSKAGFKAAMNSLDDDHRLLYLVGEPGDLAGYSPGRQSDDDPITGRLNDTAGFPYKTSPPNKFRPWVYIAVHAEDDTTFEGGDSGRVLWNQEIVGL